MATASHLISDSDSYLSDSAPTKQHLKLRLPLKRQRPLLSNIWLQRPIKSDSDFFLLVPLFTHIYHFLPLWPLFTHIYYFYLFYCFLPTFTPFTTFLPSFSTLTTFCPPYNFLHIFRTFNTFEILWLQRRAQNKRPCSLLEKYGFFDSDKNQPKIGKNMVFSVIFDFRELYLGNESLIQKFPKIILNIFNYHLVATKKPQID